MSIRSLITLIAIVLTLVTSNSFAAEWGLKKGTIELKSPGLLAFGPDHILFIGDAKTATVYALDTGDYDGDASKVKVNVTDLPGRVAKALGVKSATIKDIAVNPANGTVYVSVAMGSQGAIVKISGDKVSAVSLKGVKTSKATLPNPPEDKVTGQGRRQGNRRLQSITYLAYHENKVYVSGLTNAKSPSSICEFAFPFVGEGNEANIEYYHGAHGRLENYSAVRAFVPFVIDGKPNLLAGFTCTPLVRFPVQDMRSKMKITGTTIAELGNRNRPLDMIVYEQGGKHFLLISNSARGVMKVKTDDIGRSKGITSRVGGGGVAGQSYDTIKELKGTMQMAKLNDTHIVVLINNDLRTVALP